MAIKIAKQKVDPAEQLEHSRTQDRSRDETQLELDKEVGAIVAEWRGMVGDNVDPATVPVDKRPRLRFAVDPSERAELNQMIRRACTFHKVDPHFYKNTEDSRGRSVLTFTVQPRKPKTH